MFMFPNKPRRIFSASALTGTIDYAQWIVQPKWNGHRVLPYVDAGGKATLYSRHGRSLTRARNDFAWLGMVDLPRPWGLDGELLNDGRMIVWDFYVLGGKVCIRDTYASRLRELVPALPRRVAKGAFSLELVESLAGGKYRNLMLRRGQPQLEGFVLKRRDAVDMWGPYRTDDVASMFKYRF